MADFIPLDYAALAMRLFLGISFAAHGFPKLFIAQGRTGTMQWLQSMNIPPFLAPLAGILEFFGGIALIFGFLTPLVSGLMVLEMLGTGLWINRKKMGKKWFGGWDLDIMYMGLAAGIFLLGAGAISLDAALNVPQAGPVAAGVFNAILP